MCVGCSPAPHGMLLTLNPDATFPVCGHAYSMYGTVD